MILEAMREQRDLVRSGKKRAIAIATPAEGIAKN